MILYSLNTDPPASVVSQFRLHGTPGPQRDDDLPPSNDPSPRRGGIDDEVGDLDNPRTTTIRHYPGASVVVWRVVDAPGLHRRNYPSRGRCDVA